MSLALPTSASKPEHAPPDVRTRLARAGQELARALRRPTFLDRLCTITTGALDACAGCTLVRDAGSGRFLPVARKATARRTDRIADPSHALVEEVARRLQRQSVLEATDPADGDDGPEPRARWLCIALRRRNRLVGMVLAQRRAGRPGLSTDDLAVAEGIGSLASLCLENARLTSELERVEHIKADFVATISHELRTPLNIILGYVSLLLEGDFGPLSDEQSSALTHVDRSAHALLELIQSMLDLSRLEREGLPVAHGEIVVADLLAELVRDGERLPHGAQVELHSHADDDLLIRSDPGKLRIVLKSLISNAIKFTARGAVDLRARACGDGVEISVADTGIGIPRDAWERIFEPFTQLGEASTRAHGGVGMGLHVARRLTELLGGTIAVKSRVGAGSTFQVWIPAANPTAEHGAAPLARVVNRKPRRDLGDRK